MSVAGAEDEVTGLHHRRGFTAALKRQISYANEQRTKLALIVADIDGFAAINAAFGYDFGDQVLRHVAAQVRKVARPHDVAARIGDNRFALILPRVMNQGHVELAVQKLLRMLDLPYESGNARVKPTITIGASLCPLHSSHPEHLLRDAEACIQRARREGVDFMFPPERGADDVIAEDWDIEIDLADAVRRGEMAMHYQPKLRIADGRPVGAEALMRWTSRSRGLVSPNLFIPVAERTGQIKPLTIWALNTVLRQAQEWKHPGELTVAVNVPPDMVAQHDLPDLVANALNLWGHEHVQLVLEITERSLVTTPAHSFKILGAVRALGVKVSIDDFGTGYSCLAYFKDIPADELKIDKSFVSGLLADRANAEITSLIVQLAHRFGLSVAAEGVEDAATLAALREQRCDVVQGHLFAPALKHEEFAQWLREHSA